LTIQARAEPVRPGDFKGPIMAISADDILTIVSDEVPIDRSLLDPSATLESLNIASLDMISVMFALEDKFGLIIEQDDVKEAKTLQDFLDAVLAKSQVAG
jgi:acyl carrier protein